ncbi:MAG: glutamyl-tRNA amidotransferase [Thermomicrobiales bacterium]
MSAADEWRARLRAALTAAMKARDTDAVAALRGAIATIDNAEAVELPDAANAASTGAIAGAMAGVGSTEVARRDLSSAEVRSLVLAQVADRDAAAEWSRAHGYPERAARLDREATALRAFLAALPETGDEPET